MNEKYAFPCGTEHLAKPVTAGMTLRDYFAAKAMPQTMVEFDDAWSDHAYQKEEFLRWAAERSYAMADAMLKAREK
jgi:hypothetical protein